MFPAKQIISAKVPEELQHLPVLIRTCKFGLPIGFGDAPRQYNNNEDFLLIVRFWKQDGSYKNFAAVEGVKILTSDWKNLFLPLNITDLTLLDSAIKNIELHYSEAGKIAGELKNSDKFKQTRIILNPKINSKTQRRLQCGLPFNILRQYFVEKEPYQNIDCDLFGEKVSNPFLSGQRMLKPKIEID